MKLHKILFIITFATIITQSAFAARMTVYNQTGSSINIVVNTTKGTLPVAQIPANSNKSFDSGLSSFTEINWLENNSPNDFYSCDALSSKLMLTGKVILEPKGTKVILNFDKNGISSKPITKYNILKRSKNTDKNYI
jgi:hypothetical protein